VVSRPLEEQMRRAWSKNRTEVIWAAVLIYAALQAQLGSPPRAEPDYYVVTATVLPILLIASLEVFRLFGEIHTSRKLARTVARLVLGTAIGEAGAVIAVGAGSRNELVFVATIIGWYATGLPFLLQILWFDLLAASAEEEKEGV
jgi:hypothetical protein